MSTVDPTQEDGWSTLHQPQRRIHTRPGRRAGAAARGPAHCQQVSPGPDALRGAALPPPCSSAAPSSMKMGVANSMSDRMVPAGTVTKWLLPLLFTAAWKASSFSTFSLSAFWGGGSGSCRAGL